MPLARALGRRGVAQLGSALALGARGRGFESLRPDHFGVPVAQRIERGTSNPGVAGSNPAGDTISKPFTPQAIAAFLFPNKTPDFPRRHHEPSPREVGAEIKQWKNELQGGHKYISCAACLTLCRKAIHT